MHQQPREIRAISRCADTAAGDYRTVGRWIRPGSILAGVLVLATSPVHAIVTSNVRPDTNDRVILNVHVGAGRFYNAGYFGGRTVIANIEAGHVWNGHETLGHVQTYFNDPSIEGPERQFDFHATMVGFVLNGLGPLVPDVGYYYYQFGMAPGATLASGAIATEWVNTEGQFQVSDESFVFAYRSAMDTGVPIPLFPGVTITRQADVINSSWGYTDEPATEFYTAAIDALAYSSGKTVVLAAGNHIAGDPAVVGPASGYNSISVAALGTDLSTPAYSAQAYFSNSGPNDFSNPVTGELIRGVRVAVDMAAPGTDLVLSAYTGTTGQNTGGEDPYDLADNLYAFGAGGTSFASPTVAGGAALVIDAGYDRFDGGEAVDGRVVKAVLLNSASKTPGWNNGTSTIEGIITTTQGLDNAVGTGALNLDRAFDQYLAGTANVPGLGGGSIKLIGWDYGIVGEDGPNIYPFEAPLSGGAMFTATLDWFLNRSLETDLLAASDIAYQDLDLQFWSMQDGALHELIAQSASLYNNVEHLYFSVPADGLYALVVRWQSEVFDVPGNTPEQEVYGVAWSVVPEPGGGLLLLAGGAMFFWQRARGAGRRR